MIPNNTGIYISILAVNRDPGIWGADVMEWKPERWLSPLPPSVAEARIPGVYANTNVKDALADIYERLSLRPFYLHGYDVYSNRRLSICILHRVSRMLRGLARMEAGNIGQIFDPDGWKFHADIAANYGRVVRLNGMLGDTELYISDTRALYNILIKDQHIFEESSRFISMNQVFFRTWSTVDFGQLREALTAKVGDGPKEVDMMDWMTRAALELIGQAGLGYSFDTLDDRVENAYANAVKTFLPTISSPSMIIALEFLPWLMRTGTSAFRRAVAEKTPWEDVQRLVNIVDIMDNTSREVFENKKTALEKGDEAVVHQIGEGKDIMSVLLKANMAASAEDRLPEKELLAQMSVLIFAAMDTTSSALSRTLDLLSVHQDIQDKLRAELTEAREMSNDSDFDTLHALPYLEAVCRETLRFTRKDAVLPLGTPITGVDGTKISEIMIPNNTGIYIGVLSVNRDPGIWGADVMEWKPERWLSPLPPSVAEARIPGVYANTGFKFSQLEMKIVLAVLIPAFKFSTSDKRISWAMAAVTGPVMDGVSKPTMPLVLTPVKASA
ncbi:hypothetical protein EW146_g8172 [Bondarzewia mesenterica]|uniref:Cytochrome P450 n=1 Tax=Bondarzewia mesenterica TaxID=1095465 RepID=A0A4S4LID6_9AGAM|nr:hypothetical protein EW146_g8172 [Bondarzewia mesenterica]